MQYHVLTLISSKIMNVLGTKVASFDILLVCKPEPENSVRIQFEGFGACQQHDVANVKLHVPNLFSMKQNCIFYVLTGHLKDSRNTDINVIDFRVGLILKGLTVRSSYDRSQELGENSKTMG